MFVIQEQSLATSIPSKIGRVCYPGTVITYVPYMIGHAIQGRSDIEPLKKMLHIHFKLFTLFLTLT